MLMKQEIHLSSLSTFLIVTRTNLFNNCVKFLQSQVFTLPSFVTLAQVFQTIPFTFVPCTKRGFSAQNWIHGALRNKLSPCAVEWKMYISYTSEKHLDEESVCNRAVKKFYKWRKEESKIVEWHLTVTWYVCHIIFGLLLLYILLTKKRRDSH